ncbi:MAG: hypothetical protein RLZZ292_1288 [Bacteroidota bacterium]|jgi:hypothetical protein
MRQRLFLQLFIFLLLNVFIPKNTIAQQAWTKEKGKFYAQIGASYITYSQLLNGKLSPSEWTALNAKFTDVTLQAYGEYGLTNRIMLSGQVPLKVLSSKEIVQPNTITEGSLAALSNLQAAVTANFYNQDGIVLSAKTNIGFPTAKFDAPTGLRSGFDAWSAEPSLLAGFGHAKFFASGELGYVLRGNGYSNRLHAAGQIGKFFGKKKKVLGIVNIELMKSGDNGTYNDATSSKTGLYLDKQSYLSPTFKLGYKNTEKVTLWLSLGGGLAPITKNIAASPGLTFSVSYQN